MKMQMFRKQAVLAAILLSINLAAQVQAEPKRPVPKPTATPKLGDVRGESVDDKHKDSIERRSGANKNGPKPVGDLPKSRTAQLPNGPKSVQPAGGVKPVAQSQDTKGEVKTVAKKDDKAAGKVKLKPITITKKLDKASP